MAEYRIFFRKSVWQDIEKIPKKSLQQIMKRIAALAVDPRPPGCEKLTGQERYRIRQGTYRIIYAKGTRVAAAKVYLGRPLPRAQAVPIGKECDP